MISRLYELLKKKVELFTDELKLRSIYNFQQLFKKKIIFSLDSYSMAN